MANVATSQEFVALLERSQLLDAELIGKLKPQLEKHAQTEPKRVATTLLKNQIITEYQAKQLLVGKYKGFYLARYKLMELLGMGGMGRVYLAEQVSMERLVAIKLISLTKNKDQQKQALARFAREAKAVAALRHPNIIQAFDFANENGMPYIVMEYVEGLDTARMVHKFGPVPWKQAADYGWQAAQGLAHAHQAGIVHRDIKPGNLLVDSEGHVKILDLGLVSAFNQKNDDSLTVDQDQLGTVDYIAPEQAVDSKKADARADIYSLGATLYSIMSGRVLYPDKSTAQKLLLHQTTDPEPITNLVKDCPPELAAVISKMLAKKPEARYQSANELAKALAKFAEPKNPPYELNAIKYRRSVYEGFLGKSPEPDKITVPTLGSPEADKVDASSTPRTGASQMSGKLRTASMINVASDPAIDEFALPADDYTQLAMEMPSLIQRKKGKKKKKEQSPLPLQIVAVVGSLLGLLLAAWLGNNAMRAMAKSEDKSSQYSYPEIYYQGQQAAPATPPPAAPPQPAPPPQPVAPAPEVTNPKESWKYTPVSLKAYCNTLTTVPMFNATASDIETMVLPEWKSLTIENVEFSLVDPEGKRVPNAIVLHGTIGAFSPNLPRRVEIPVKQKSLAVHFLSGVGGYCYPVIQDQSVVMRVTIMYEGGTSQQTQLLNGVHFADYIQRVDVPESKFATMAGSSQIRYLKIATDGQKMIESIILEKETDNGFSPIVLAISLQGP